MEERHNIDLTYITERIITVVFPQACAEQIYLQNLRDITLMLQSKHGHNYLLVNLSERNDSLTQMNHKILDTGWVDFLAPNLDQICSVCTTMENWLQTHPKHVLVLHCRGGKGRIGVMVASYIHFTNISASAGLSLDHYAMRRFYNDKVSALMTPSQKRYVWMLGSLLKGEMTMSPSPTFLLCIALHGLPAIRPKGGCCLFLRVYQSLQAVCTSAVYHVQAGRTDKLYVVLKPAQLLKGDIMVVCYDKNSQSASRQAVFRLQFHTSIIYGHALTFSKADLDCANGDSRFPEDGRVELMFSDSPERITGRELWQNGGAVTVDYDTLDPLVRRDSYQDLSSPGTALPHTLGPVDGSLYAKVRKKSSEEGAWFPTLTSSPCCSDLALSASSDSGLSTASQRVGGATTANARRGTGQDDLTQTRKLISGAGLELTPPPLEVMTELPASNGGEGAMAGDESGLGRAANGEASSNERETDILDDEEEVEDDEADPALDAPSSTSIASLSSESLPEAQGSVQTDYSTHTWVQQQQMVDALPRTRPPAYGEQQRRLNGGRRSPEKAPPSPAPGTPPRVTSNREAARGGVAGEDTHVTHGARSRLVAHTSSLSSEPCEEEELASLATDIDESIEQLNQLILDLDPTFIPVPNRCAPLSRSTSLYTNGLGHKGDAQPSGWQQLRQGSDETDYSGLRSPGWKGGGSQMIRNSPIHSPGLPLSQHRSLCKMDSVVYGGQTSLIDSCDMISPTPAFPVSPPTPYVKSFSGFSQFKPGGQWESNRTSQESRSFLDSMNHAAGSTEGELFRSEVSVTPASCQRIFGSMRSVSSGSPLPHTDSSTPPPPWQDRTSSSLSSPFCSQSSPPLSLSTPNAHSSPRGPLKDLGGPGARRETEDPDLSLLLLGNGALDHSLLEAVEGLGSLGLGLGLGDGGLPPLLPEKRRGGEGGELGSRSPSLSGFSSPHSGSSLSIPFSMTPDPLRGLSGAPSPGADLPGSKHDTVKFVQDTSKFWYKPDISRDQAIAVLKDKEPGSFVVRDSHSFRGAYGLAMKVATPPPSVLQQSKKAGDLSNELVRHFLIECTQKGVRLKGCPNEPYFGSLTALVCQHSITPLALPCKLILPDRDPTEELNDSSPQTATNSAAELLKQGAACNVWYLGSVELESLTGHQAVQKATSLTLATNPLPTSTVVHFKVSAQGITLTDNQRKLFFRRHYTVNTVIFCSLDPQGRKWTKDGSSTAKIFGFVARKSQSGTENVCHLFAEHDPEQPASAIVNFVSKVMIGSHKK
ncbi:tensin 3-2 [Polymixia lowei]